MRKEREGKVYVNDAIDEVETERMNLRLDMYEYTRVLDAKYIFLYRIKMYANDLADNIHNTKEISMNKISMKYNKYIEGMMSYVSDIKELISNITSCINVAMYIEDQNMMSIFSKMLEKCSSLLESYYNEVDRITELCAKEIQYRVRYKFEYEGDEIK